MTAVNKILVPVKKPHTISNLGTTDTQPLKDLVQQLSNQVWIQEDKHKENNFPCFHHTQHIIFRFIKKNQDHRDFYSNPIWEIFKPTLLPIMEQVVVPYGFTQPEYPKVMLARLESGQFIDRHRDGAGSNLHTHKIHIPLYTSSQVNFLVRDKPHSLKEGFAYEVNNIVPHEVRNDGNTDRIHFIFEVFESSIEIDT